MTAAPRYVPPSARLHFGRVLAEEIDLGYAGSAQVFYFERYSLCADARPRPNCFLLILDVMREGAPGGQGIVHPRDYDIVLYGAGDAPVPLADVGRLVQTSPVLPPDWHLHLSLDVLRSLSCTLTIHPPR